MPLGTRTGQNPRADMTRNLARKGHAFLGMRLLLARRFGRQLQPGRLLGFAQEGQKKGLTIRQFERVMVHMRLVTIDLAENCRLVPFFFSSRRRHTRLQGDWSSDVCSSD